MFQRRQYTIANYIVVIGTHCARIAFVVDADRRRTQRKQLVATKLCEAVQIDQNINLIANNLTQSMH
jgi:hypothetical protein